MESHSDEWALIASARSGTPAAWEGIVTRHQDRVFTLCLRLMGERESAADMTQETFIKAIQGLRGFDQRSQLSTWLYRIATNTCLSELRARRHRERAKGGDQTNNGGYPLSRSAESGLESREPASDSGVQQMDTRRKLLEGLARVTDDQRAILVLRDVRGLDYAQIAVVLRIAPGTVRSRLFRARAALRKELAAIERGEPRLARDDDEQAEAFGDDSNWDTP